jgi:hypothetical protein
MGFAHILVPLFHRGVWSGGALGGLQPATDPDRMWQTVMAAGEWLANNRKRPALRTS